MGEGAGEGVAEGDIEQSGAELTPESARPAIAVDGLKKTFGGGTEAITAVDDVSFTVTDGSVVGVLGPNGAGKTTMIKSILGMILPDAGTIRIHGVDVHADPRRAYRHVDAMLEGARNDYWRLTVRENLRYFATISGVKPDSVAGRYERLLDQLDLADKADTPVRELSRGMKQKVSLASVLATDADVVFLDEPTLGLDVESSVKLRHELRRIVDDRGLTAVLSSHDMDVIEAVCDRVIILNEGRIITDDTVANLLRGFETRGFRVSSPNVDEGTLTAVRTHFDVTDVRRYDGHVRLEVATDSDGFYALTALLRSRNVTIETIETVTPDLEDAFLEMTDRDRR